MHKSRIPDVSDWGWQIDVFATTVSSSNCYQPFRLKHNLGTGYANLPVSDQETIQREIDYLERISAETKRVHEVVLMKIR